jgi:hypothetical protein
MKSLFLTVVMLIVFTDAFFAQSTTIKLPTANNSSCFVVTDNADAVLLKIFGNGGFYMLGSSTNAPLSVTGAGPRLMWDPYNPAFRAGYVDGTQWDAANIGAYSSAMGANTKASGRSSTAMGNLTTASGPHATAMGYSTTASGESSTAMGNYTTASGDYSTAIGYCVSTNGFGSCIIGDNSTGTVTNSSMSNQMTMRFANGYHLYSSSDLTTGVSISAGGSSWSTISDSTKKEHFAKANGEYFLQSISQLRLGSWNYKGQNAQHYRHYGPMAQEIFHYFGKDQNGTIGNDTILASADMDGIMMICLQALEKRTSELQRATASISELEKTVSEQRETLASRNKEIDKLKSDFIQFKKEIVAMMELKPSSAHSSLISADLPK